MAISEENSRSECVIAGDILLFFRTLEYLLDNMTKLYSILLFVVVGGSILFFYLYDFPTIPQWFQRVYFHWLKKEADVQCA